MEIVLYKILEISYEHPFLPVKGKQPSKKRAALQVGQINT